MARTVAITGSASGIGKATAEMAEAWGWRPIRIDLREGDICADLGSAEGRDAMITDVAAMCGGKLDALIACAGLSIISSDAIVRVNFFGALASLAGLRPLLAKGSEPRAVAITSFASLMPTNPQLIEACLREDETAALEIANQNTSVEVLYPASKAALARWIRRAAIEPAWVGNGILLNAIAPGFVRTPMVGVITGDPERRAELEKTMPMPINRDLQPDEMAELLMWLASPANSTMVGQIIFADGGAEASVRGNEIW